MQYELNLKTNNPLKLPVWKRYASGFFAFNYSDWHKFREESNGNPIAL